MTERLSEARVAAIAANPYQTDPTWHEITLLALEVLDLRTAMGDIMDTASGLTRPANGRVRLPRKQRARIAAPECATCNGTGWYYEESGDVTATITCHCRAAPPALGGEG